MMLQFQAEHQCDKAESHSEMNCPLPHLEGNCIRQVRRGIMVLNLEWPNMCEMPNHSEVEDRESPGWFGQDQALL